jgi:O-antigen/teichoic acid export membrane protein
VSQVVQQSVTTASIPVLSKEYVENRVVSYKTIVKKYTTLLGMVGVVISLLLYLGRDEVIFLLYGETAYHNLIKFFLVGFLFALPFQMMVGYFSISFYSIKDTKSVLVSNFFASTLAILVCYITKKQGDISLVYGSVTMILVNFLLLFVLYSRKKL